MKKRLLSILLAAVMLLSALPLGLVDTAEAAAVSSGTCGENVTWTLDDQGTLTISGTGAMYDYTYTWEADKGDTFDTPWFDLREQIRRAVVGKGVTFIGTGTFAFLYNLTSVSLPAGLEELGNSVFCGCEKLTSVTIPDGVRYAGGDLFYGCRSLKTVSLPDSLQGLGGATFLGCTSLTKVTLPRRLNQVTWHMFYGCTALTTVTLPDGIQEISEGAFSGCKALSTVHFGGSQAGWRAVTVRPDNDALERAKVDYAAASMLPAPKLTGSVSRYGELTLNWNAVKGADSYQIFRAEKFQNSWQYYRYDWVGGSQTSLSLFQHEAGETYVYKVRAMANDDTAGICSNEYTFTYNPTGPGAASSGSGKCGDNAKWTLDTSGTLTISGTGAMYNYDFIGDSNPAPWCADGLNNRVRTVVVKKGITELGYNAFAECPQLEKVTLPSGLKRIGSCAFIDCFSLPELTIPATVTTIESNAFTNCNSIKTLTLPGGLKEIGDAACSQMGSLSSVTLGKGITRLSPYMFNMCYELTSVTIPEGVTDIGYFAFRYCENLQTLRLPASLKTVGEAASSGTNIADVYFAGTAAQWNALHMDPGNNHIRCAKVHYRNAATVPAAPKIKLTTSGNQFQLSWNAVPGAASYQVYRIVDFTVEDYTLLGTTKSTTYTDKTAEAGTTYTFAVKAVNANGESMTSSSCAGKLAAAPDNVTLTGAKAVSDGIQVTWQAANGAAEYRVYRKDAANPKWKGIANVTGTSWTDKTAQAGVKYTYTVRGISANGTLSPGFDTTGVSATIPGAPTPTAPANVTLGSAKVSGSTIVVTWQAANGAAQYRVYRKDAANPKWKGIANVTGTSWTDKTAKTGVTYTYTVRGISANGTLSPGFDTTGVSATVPGAPTPTTPANVPLGSAKVSGSTIVVTWQAANGAAQYRVYRKDAANPKWKGIANVTGTSWTDKTAVAGVKYTYTVRGISANGTLSPGFDTTGVSATIPAAPAPTTPAEVTLIGAVAGSDGITVKWKAAAGAKEYRVYRKGPGETKWKGLVNVTGISWTDRGVKAGAKYTYTVRGIGADGKTLSPTYNNLGVSTTATVTPVPITPANVTLIGATAGSSGITVTWKTAAGAEKYRVYRIGPGETKWKGLVNVTGTGWTDTNVKAGVKYTYTVRGISVDGKLSPGFDKTGVSAVAK